MGLVNAMMKTQGTKQGREATMTEMEDSLKNTRVC